MSEPRHEIIKAIRKERERQVKKEGWTPEHDASYMDGEIGLAAACYAAPCPIQVRGRPAWPWNRAWDKRDKHDRKRQLVIAGALIVAELERLQAMETQAETGPAADGNG